MSLKHGILGFIKYGVDTGYELNKTFRDSLDNFWHATASQIYRELAWLEAHEMVTAQEQVQTGKPNKKLYQITAKGEQELQQWLASGVPDMMRIRNSFLVKVFFSGLQDVDQTLQTFREFDEQCEIVRQQTREWEDSIVHYSDQMEDSWHPVYWELTSDFGIRYLNMCQEWSTESQRKLKQRRERESCGESS
ncbi:MAG: PadR family transcriptional regulator [Lachnospiraceae bacterium]